MKFPFLFLLFLAQISTINGQANISGNIRDTKGEPIAGANIYFEGTFEGTTSDTSGRFSLTTRLEGERTLIVSYMGYESYRQPLELNHVPVTIDVTLNSIKKDLGEVVITVGTFAAGDESKSAVLSTLDMATSSGGFGDITSAISSLPGTSNAGEEGGLMVRGGERYETATFIDGMGVNDAFTAKLPDVPVRGRFSPMLFRGTVFSTGGYSAEYGQALSSVLILNSIAMPKKDEMYISAHTAGLYLSYTRKWDRTAFSATTGYNNMRFLYALLKSNVRWQHAPVNISENLVFRQKIGANGMLKAMGAYGYDHSAMYYRILNTGEDLLYRLENSNYFMIATYRDRIGKNWILHSGITFGYDDLAIAIQDTAAYKKHKKTTELKLSFAGPVSSKISLNVGASLFIKTLNQQYVSNPGEGAFTTGFLSPVVSIYAETEMNLTKRISSRIGARFEALSLSSEVNLAPRFALAYKTSRYSQISLGYGQFYQQAQDDFLMYNHNLESEKAEHFIANFQYRRNGRTFRIEAYHKLYDKLVKYDSLYAIEAGSYNNDGGGYAQGIDLFFRDTRTIKNGDFWLSYSLMNSERNNRDNTIALTPAYLSRHNLSIVYKHYIELTDSYLSMGYTFSSGRPYVDPNISNMIQQRTKACHDLGFTIFHFTEIFGKFTMLFAQVTNVLGTNHIYGYRFATAPDHSGLYRSEPILPVSRRFFLVGIHVSFTGQTDI
jgi:vitamin B12 transporter